MDKEYSQRFFPVYSSQKAMQFNIYYTPNYNSTYCDEAKTNLLGSFDIDLPDVHLGTDRPVLLTLCFGSMEIVVTAKNETNGKVYRTTFSSAE